MSDYWEHTYDVENTYKLVESMLKNTWNYGNPNKEDRADKVLKRGAAIRFAAVDPATVKGGSL